MLSVGRFVLAATLVAATLARPSLGQLPKKEFLTSDGSRPTGLFAPGIRVGDTVYVAGKGDYRPDEAFPEKVRNCLREVEKVLEREGLGMQHVVKSFVYLEDHDKFPEFNQEYAKFFPEAPPARTTLGVSQVPGPSRVEITCIAHADLQSRKTIGEPPGDFPFSPAVQAGDTVYVSGKGDHLSDGSHPLTFEEQVRQAMRNVQATLDEAGLDFQHVVMSHVFLDDDANLETANRVYREFVKAGDEPACATVFVDWIPGGSHVEVTCIATTDLDSRKTIRPRELLQTSDSVVAASPGVLAGDTLYISGLSGAASEKSENTGSLSEQVHQMAANHQKVIEAANMDLADIVSGYVYLRDMDDYNEMNGIYKNYFSRGPGVRTCLMPNRGYEGNDILVRGSFTAVRTAE